MVRPQAERFRVPRGFHDRITGHMEELQNAWVRALAAASGCQVFNPTVIDDGIDVLLTHKHPDHSAIPEQIASLRLQLKSTTAPVHDGSAQAQVSIKRFREYAVREPHTDVIVVIQTMPRCQQYWVHASDRALSLFGASYWVNLAGLAVPEGDDHSRVAVRAPVSQVLDDVSLAQIMERIGKGGTP